MGVWVLRGSDLNKRGRKGEVGSTKDAMLAMGVA